MRLPSKPYIQPVKGGVNRDYITSGFGNGILSQLCIGNGESETEIFRTDTQAQLDPAEAPFEYQFILHARRSTGDYDAYSYRSVIVQGLTLPFYLQGYVINTWYVFKINEEILGTSDYTEYQSDYEDWVTYSLPLVYVNGNLADSADYEIDYINGTITFDETIRGNTALFSQANSGQNQIVVASATGLAEGDLIVIQGNTTPDEDEAHTIDTIAGTTITLESNLTYTHNSGRTVLEQIPVVKATFKACFPTSLPGWFDNSPPEYVTMLIKRQAQLRVVTDYMESGEYGILPLKNSCFLSWEGDDPLGWSVGGSGTGAVSKVAGILRPTGASVTGAVELQVDSGAGYYLKQTIPIRDNSLNLYGRVLCKVDSGKASLELVPDVGTAQKVTLDTTSASGDPSFSGKWTMLEIRDKFTGASNLEVRILAEPGYTAYFDNICITEEY